MFNDSCYKNVSALLHKPWEAEMYTLFWEKKIKEMSKHYKNLLKSSWNYNQSWQNFLRVFPSSVVFWEGSGLPLPWDGILLARLTQVNMETAGYLGQDGWWTWYAATDPG